LASLRRPAAARRDGRTELQVSLDFLRLAIFSLPPACTAALLLWPTRGIGGGERPRDGGTQANSRGCWTRETGKSRAADI